MKEWKIVIGIPGQIIVGSIKIESTMVDARTETILNRKISSRSSGSELNLTGFIKLSDVSVSEHNNRDYQETRRYTELLMRKSDIFFAYDEVQPKSVEIPVSPAGEGDLIQKKSIQLDLITRVVSNSYYQISGHFTGFLKHFEDNDFVQLKNVTITEFLKKEDGFLKLKYDQKAYVSVNTKCLFSVSKVPGTD